MQEAHHSMWSPVFPTYIQMVIALFPTKTNLWFCVLVLHLGLVKGKALKNFSDYPLSKWLCHIAGKVGGILFVSVSLPIFDLSEISRFQFNSHCPIDMC